MDNYSKQKIVDFSLIKCVFLFSRPMKIGTFLRENGETPKWVVDFLLEKHIPKK